MSLVGTYVNANTGETLNITEAVDDGGTLSGTLKTTVDGKTYTLQVSGRYHYYDSHQSSTNVTFYATVSGAAVYEAWSGIGQASSDYSELQMMGSRSIMSSNSSTEVVGLGGVFARS